MNLQAARSRFQRSMQNLLVWAAETPSEPVEEDLADVPTEFRRAVWEQVRTLRRLWSAGEQGAAHRQAGDAAALLAMTVYPHDRPAGGATASDPADVPLSGGSDPTAPYVEMDPARLAAAINERTANPRGRR